MNTTVTNLDKWVAALRSGEYTQGKFSLKSEDGFCCLGVACDIYAKETGLGKWQESTEEYLGKYSLSYNFINKEDKMIGKFCIPKEVMSWLGFEPTPQKIDFKLKRNLKITTPEETVDSRSLAYLNDHGATFTEIADAIESYGLE